MTKFIKLTKFIGNRKIILRVQDVRTVTETEKGSDVNCGKIVYAVKETVDEIGSML